MGKVDKKLDTGVGSPVGRVSVTVGGRLKVSVVGRLAGDDAGAAGDAGVVGVLVGAEADGVGVDDGGEPNKVMAMDGRGVLDAPMVAVVVVDGEELGAAEIVGVTVPAEGDEEAAELGSGVVVTDDPAVGVVVGD